MSNLEELTVAGSDDGETLQSIIAEKPTLKMLNIHRLKIPRLKNNINIGNNVTNLTIKDNEFLLIANCQLSFPQVQRLAITVQNPTSKFQFFHMPFTNIQELAFLGESSIECFRNSLKILNFCLKILQLSPGIEYFTMAIFFWDFELSSYFTNISFPSKRSARFSFIFVNTKQEIRSPFSPEYLARAVKIFPFCETMDFLFLRFFLTDYEQLEDFVLSSTILRQLIFRRVCAGLYLDLPFQKRFGRYSRPDTVDFPKNYIHKEIKRVCGSGISSHFFLDVELRQEKISKS